MQARIWLLGFVGWLSTTLPLWQLSVRAEDFYFQVSWRDLKLADAENAEQLMGRALKANFLRSGPKEVLLQDGGEAFFAYPLDTSAWQQREPTFAEFRILGRLPESRSPSDKQVANQSQAITGRLIVREGAADKNGVLKFAIPVSALQPGNETEFYKLRALRYERLALGNTPGAAWFRHQLAVSRQAQGGLTAADQEQWRLSDLARESQQRALESRQQSFVTGGRAISENLQLDRMLPAARGAASSEQLVALDQIKGITIKEFDWQPLLKNPRPALDPLASYIPADQYAVFFPSLPAALEVIDEARRQGNAVLSQIHPPTENRHLVERYERQMGLSLNEFGRLVGLQLVSSVAITGGDPDFATGTDLAVLFETSKPEFLAQLLTTQARVAAVFTPGSDRLEGTISGLKYQAVRSADRRLCSYVVELGNAVLVTNSPIQIERVASVRAKQTAAIDSLNEYHFFRQRYARNDAHESALLFISDATIRGWCGPHWRIAQARRTRDAAVMWDLQAEHLNSLVTGKDLKLGSLQPKWSTSQPSELLLTANGIESPQLGRLDFLTPISEMKFDQVTSSERQAYERWRNGYQSNWSGAFDPIALRVGVSKERLSADLSIMPLIMNSQYRWLVQFIDGAKLVDEAGDANEKLFDMKFALNPQSQLMQMVNQFAKVFMTEKDEKLAADKSFDPLGWVGDKVRFYADFDPYWLELQPLTSSERTQKLRAEGYTVPVAIEVAIRDPLKLPMFHTGLKALLQREKRFLFRWDDETYRDQTHVKVTTQSNKAEPENRVFLGAVGDVLLITPNEALLKRAIDRHMDQKQKAPRPTHNPPLGESVSVSMSAHAPELSMWFNGTGSEPDLLQESWNNLPILNEWKRLYPDRDPLEVHRRFWGSELLCPGGGNYVWNNEWQTMESTVCGHPAAPKRLKKADAPKALFRRLDAGMTFELSGLRARLELQRAD